MGLLSQGHDLLTTLSRLSARCESSVFNIVFSLDLIMFLENFSKRVAVVANMVSAGIDMFCHTVSFSSVVTEI